VVHVRPECEYQSSANLAYNRKPWPIIAVTCLAFETEIAAGPGVEAVPHHVRAARGTRPKIKAKDGDRSASH
jgi:hypothetical protein